MGKYNKIKMFASHNDTDKWAVCVDGYYGLFASEADADRVYRSIMDGCDHFDGSPFGSCVMLAPHHIERFCDGSEPDGGFDRISLHHPINIEDYICKAWPRRRKNYRAPITTAKQRLEAQKRFNELFGG